MCTFQVPDPIPGKISEFYTSQKAISRRHRDQSFTVAVLAQAKSGAHGLYRQNTSCVDFDSIILIDFIMMSPPPSPSPRGFRTCLDRTNHIVFEIAVHEINCRSENSNGHNRSRHARFTFHPGCASRARYRKKSSQQRFMSLYTN